VRQFLSDLLILLRRAVVSAAQILLSETSCPLCFCAYKNDLDLSYGLCGDCLDFFSALTSVKTTLSGDERTLPELVCFSAGFYEGLLRESVYQIKYLKNRELLQYLGMAMQPPTVALLNHLSSAQTPHPGQCILLLPVPLHKGKLKERSFNQAAALAIQVQKSAKNMRVKNNALLRMRATAPQFGLSRDERRINLAGAFCADRKIVAGKRVIIVDDILTSGATLYECAIAATAAGATVVGAITFGRARWQATYRDQAHIVVPSSHVTDIKDRSFLETSERHDKDAHLPSATRHQGYKARL